MSWKYVGWAWTVDPGLSAVQRLVLLKLADHVGDGETTCFPRIGTLANALNLSGKSVSRAVAVLEERGHLTRHFRQCRSTIYEFKPLSVQFKVGADEADSVAEVGDTESRSTGHRVPVGGHRVPQRGDTESRIISSRESVTKPASETEEPPNPPTGYTHEFEQFWAAYRKTGRGKGKREAFIEWGKQWRKLGADRPTVGQLISDIETRLKNDWDWIKEEGKFIPWACRYLKGRRWEDDMAEEPVGVDRYGNRRSRNDIIQRNIQRNYEQELAAQGSNGEATSGDSGWSGRTFEGTLSESDGARRADF